MDTTYQEKGIIPHSRLLQEVVSEKMKQIQVWMEQIKNEELTMEAYGYEDYSEGYWNSEWCWEYTDNHHIGEKIMLALNFAKDCVNDCRYEEALAIYDMILDMEIFVENDCDNMSIGLVELLEEDLIQAGIREICLYTLYSDYQVRKPEECAEDMYTYFQYPLFENIHLEDIFRVGRENLQGIDEFMEKWIQLLAMKEDAHQCKREWTAQTTI